MAIRDTSNLDLLVVAPAGCGKTEALSLRVQGLIQKGLVKAPQRVLVTTFSNKARENIQERLHNYLSPAVIRDRVTIQNFHGFAARVFRAHANVIGLNQDMILPDNDWVGVQCREMHLDFKTIAEVQKSLREAKQEPRTDDEIEALLQQAGGEAALAIERRRVSEGLLTYDDMLRVAELILTNDEVAQLYRAHFGSVIVDEFQDLTPQQLRVVNRIGYGRTTYAGDLAQGIYGFAGAKPLETEASIREECGTVIELNESHRSAPAVLSVVNSLSGRTQGSNLVSADPSSWPGGGLAAVVSHATAEAEAEWVCATMRAIAVRAPMHRIAVISRTTSRRRFVEEELHSSGITFFRWDDGVLDTDTARRVRKMLKHFAVASYEQASDKMSYMRESSGLDSLIDPGDRDSLLNALVWCHDLLCDGETPNQIMSRINVGDAATLLSAPGIHALTGHIGKGQQFDWVFIIGAEDGVIPDFRANDQSSKDEEARVLSVMVSRARHGVILTHASQVAAQSGRVITRKPSPFLSDIAESNPTNAQGIISWFNSNDWTAIAAR